MEYNIALVCKKLSKSQNNFTLTLKSQIWLVLLVRLKFRCITENMSYPGSYVKDTYVHKTWNMLEINNDFQIFANKIRWMGAQMDTWKGGCVNGWINSSPRPRYTAWMSKILFVWECYDIRFPRLFQSCVLDHIIKVRILSLFCGRYT